MLNLSKCYLQFTFCNKLPSDQVKLIIKMPLMPNDNQ